MGRLGEQPPCPILPADGRRPEASGSGGRTMGEAFGRDWLRDGQQLRGCLMTWQDIRERALRLAGVFGGRNAERDIADELEFHLAMSRDKHASLPPDAAAAQACQQFGSVEKWKEVCRDVGRSRDRKSTRLNS